MCQAVFALAFCRTPRLIVRVLFVIEGRQKEEDCGVKLPTELYLGATTRRKTSVWCILFSVYAAAKREFTLMYLASFWKRISGERQSNGVLSLHQHPSSLIVQLYPSSRNLQHTQPLHKHQLLHHLGLTICTLRHTSHLFIVYLQCPCI
jgi:hypothetical protein